MNRNQNSQGQRRASVLTEAVEATEGSSQLDSFGKINRCIVDCSLQKANSKEILRSKASLRLASLQEGPRSISSQTGRQNPDFRCMDLAIGVIGQERTSGRLGGELSSLETPLTTSPI